MNTNIANIEIGLKKYGKIYLPNIGLFTIHRESASPNWDELALNPPHENIVFISDEELFNISMQNIKIPEVCKLQSESMMSNLISQKEVDLPSLGRLLMDNQQHIQFIPYESNVINAFYNELKPVPFELVDHDVPIASIAEPVLRKPASKNSRWFLLLLILPFLLIYFYSNRNSDFPLEKIPNGKVNIKPELPPKEGVILLPEHDNDKDTEAGHVIPEIQNDSNAEERNWNAKKSESHSSPSVEFTNPCYIIVGSFLNHHNSVRLKEKLEADGYTVQLFPYQSYMRVGIHLDCIDADSTLSTIRQNIHKDAWLIK